MQFPAYNVPCQVCLFAIHGSRPHLLIATYSASGLRVQVSRFFDFGEEKSSVIQRQQRTRELARWLLADPKPVTKDEAAQKGRKGRCWCPRRGTQLGCKIHRARSAECGWHGKAGKSLLDVYGRWGVPVPGMRLETEGNGMMGLQAVLALFLAFRRIFVVTYGVTGLDDWMIPP